MCGNSLKIGIFLLFVPWISLKLYYPFYVPMSWPFLFGSLSCVILKDYITIKTNCISTLKNFVVIVSRSENLWISWIPVGQLNEKKWEYVFGKYWCINVLKIKKKIYGSYWLKVLIINNMLLRLRTIFFS